MNSLYKRLAIPYQVWLVLLVFLPIMAILLIAISNLTTANFNLSDISFQLSHWNDLVENQSLVDGEYFNSYLTAFKNSFIYASITTLVSFIFGYFLAYQIKKSRIKNKFIILTIIILPMWSNLILRSEALRSVMLDNNIFKSIFGFDILPFSVGTPAAVLFGLIFTYMPFMILPVYTALEKIEVNLEEASLDLGLTPFKTFWKVVFPLSFKGVVSGSIMVFLPTFAGFAIPKILSNGNIVLIGNIIETKFTYNIYNVGSMLALLILILILGSILLLTRFDKEGETLL
ncbi:MAG: ABC transporter permease [Bacilli bacterium]|nr:ABC transporter permease [Bacilli bacterium]MBN2876250.1 ABC transporter permease [Bacilli bacterium]